MIQKTQCIDRLLDHIINATFDENATVPTVVVTVAASAALAEVVGRVGISTDGPPVCCIDAVGENAVVMETTAAGTAIVEVYSLSTG